MCADWTTLWFRLHDVILCRSRHCEFVWSAITFRHDPGKVVMRRWRRNVPFQRRGLPGIVAGLLALEHAPEKVEVEPQLDDRRDDCRYGHKQHQPVSILQELVFTKLRIAARHADHPHCMERHEDGIDADEGDPEMKLAQAFTHHAAKHFRKP